MNGSGEISTKSIPGRESHLVGEIPAHPPHVRATALETTFPFEAVSEVAEVESWRKEVYRPIYHVHKWWAQRLGSVFRALLIGAATDEDADVMELFHSNARFENLTVFDPFMGSGTTVGEALKLGFRSIGRDINPVACFSVQTVLGELDRNALIAAFSELEQTVGKQLSKLYRSVDSSGRDCDVLYYFWVKTVDCLHCSAQVDLFNSYIFAKHAYPKKYPEAKAVCPGCASVLAIRVDAEHVTCSSCNLEFDPRRGPAKNQTATCQNCSKDFPILAAVRKHPYPPKHRMYAKLVLTRDGNKEYLPITNVDRKLYDSAVERLASENDPYPITQIEPGHNTNQAINYGYRSWHQMFNERQLLSISLLAKGICAIKEPSLRNPLFCLLSGTLEFNNMFASYKGEGTGAVRHMFSHHILKPERTPLEANLWGTPKSSGAFSTLFRSRLLRALDYRETPFEIKGGGKCFGLSDPIGTSISTTQSEFEKKKTRAYISCGSSTNTDLATGSVDLIVTDPPFFDNVHYSELADFFYAWQRHYRVNPFGAGHTTRHELEVQSRDSEHFSRKLASVFVECSRVLKDSGLLVFSYHHSREEGWLSVADSVWSAGFVFSAAFPVKAEMAGASPKNAAKEPIDLDIILVCRKREFPAISKLVEFDPWHIGRSQVERFWQHQRRLSKNDIRIILMGQALVAACKRGGIESCREELKAKSLQVERVAMAIYEEQRNRIDA